MSEAAGPLNAAIDTALLADSQLTTFLGGQHVYSGELVPGRDPDDYIVLGSDDSAKFGRFMGKSERNGLTIDLWVRRQRSNDTQIYGKARVLTLAAHVSRILNGARLTLDGYGEGVTGRADLQAAVLDPDKLYWHGVLRYTGIAIAIAEES